MTNDLENNNVIVRKSGLAIASMVLGIVSIVLVFLAPFFFLSHIPPAWSRTLFLSFGIVGLIGLAFGIITLFRIHKSNGTLTGRGMGSSPNSAVNSIFQ